VTSILDHGRAIAAMGQTPLAVLDVDLTLLENGPRTRAILADWVHSVRDRWADADAALMRAPTMPLVFNARENLRTLGVEDDALARDGLGFWWRAFFTDRYAHHDVPLAGAVDVVRALRAADITVVYLTARPTQMVAGTVRRFREVGLPINEPGAMLVMRPDDVSDQGQFKRDALRWLSTLGRAVLCADNEPAHVNAMQATFPEARTVLVDTRHSPGAPALAEGIDRVLSLRGLLTH
jgi:hypothetical protein